MSAVDTAAVKRENAELRRRIDELQRKEESASEMTHAERDAISALQARADSIAIGLGQRGCAPSLGEGYAAYRLRVLQQLQPFSPTFKDTRLDASRPDFVAVMGDRIIAEAETVSRSGEALPGKLVAEVTRDESGRKITKFRGDPLACWAPFMTGGQCGHIVKPGF